MNWSRKGARDNTLKLVWTKYYKYLIGDTEYYFKQKAYATYCDGWIDSEKITKRTYNNALKKGKECIEVILHKDMEIAEVEHLIIIFSEILDIPRADVQRYIKKVMEAIKFINNEYPITNIQAYTMFVMILGHYTKSKESTEEGDQE